MSFACFCPLNGLIYFVSPVVADSATEFNFISLARFCFSLCDRASVFLKCFNFIYFSLSTGFLRSSGFLLVILFAGDIASVELPAL